MCGSSALFLIGIIIKKVSGFNGMVIEYSFEKLKVWQRAMELSREAYRLSRKFPDDEKYGMVSQFRRAAVSVSLNIAEGKGRHYNKVFLQFLFQARGSLYEVVTLTKLAVDIGYLSNEDAADLFDICHDVSLCLVG